MLAASIIFINYMVMFLLNVSITANLQDIKKMCFFLLMKLLVMHLNEFLTVLHHVVLFILISILLMLFTQPPVVCVSFNMLR